MNKKVTGKLLLLFIMVVLAIGIGMIVNRYNTESFVPAINRFYRPHVRNMRNYTSEKWNHVTNGVHRFLKKFGIK